jgi:hypothetical protein
MRPGGSRMIFGRIMRPKYFYLAFFAPCGKVNRHSFFPAENREKFREGRDYALFNVLK